MNIKETMAQDIASVIGKLSDGETVNIIRKRLGLSQFDLAVELKTTPTEISSIERGAKNLTDSMKKELVQIYKVRGE